MKWIKLKEINTYKGKSINPAKKSDEEFEMYSVPSYDEQSPEMVTGKEIGSNKQLVEKDDILLCKINPRINRVWIVASFTEKITIASSEWIVVRNHNIYSRYLMWYFRSDYFRQLMISNVTGIGGSLTRAQPKQVGEYLIPIVSYDIQMKIACALDKAQELIDKRKEQIAACDELIKSLFYHMFGDPVTNNKKWVRGKVRDLVYEVKYGTSKKADKNNGKYPVLRMNNITYQGNIDLSDLKYVDLEDNELDKYLVYKGDILFNRTNSKELVGKTAVYDENTSMAYAGYLVRARANERANPQYISAFLNSSYGKSTLQGICKSIVGMANINAQELQEIKILVPPIGLQNEFAIKQKKIQKQKALFAQSLTELENNFNSLMQRAFKGELF